MRITVLRSGIAASAILGIALMSCGNTETTGTPDGQTEDRDSSGTAAVELDRETQERAGIVTIAAERRTHRAELTAYGTLEQDPSAVYVLRAPLAGVPTPEPDRGWPALGERLADGTVVGHIRPRYAAAEQVALNERLAQARAEVKAASAGVETAQAAYERARTLNADDKNISDRAVEEARERVVALEARLEAAIQTRAAIGSALQTGSPPEMMPLSVERGGEVVELLARPGEDVQAGDAILRTARFGTLLARVFIPAAGLLPRPSRTARIVPVGMAGTALSGAYVADVPGAAAQLQGRTLLYRLSTGALQLRPGTGVMAYLPVGGEERSGVVIPRDAVVRHQGLTFVYIQQGETRFTRTPVPELEPVEDGYFVPSGLAEGDLVVTVGAQALLGEEMKSLISVGEDD